MTIFTSPSMDHTDHRADPSSTLVVLFAALVGFGVLALPDHSFASDPPVVPKVTAARVIGPKPAGFGSRIAVTVENRDVLRASSQPGKPIVLFANGLELEKLQAEAYPAGKQEIHFRLTRSSDERADWARILRSPWKARSLEFSVGLMGDRQPVETSDGVSIPFEPVSWVTFWGWLGFVLLLVVGVCVLGRRTTLLRDASVTAVMTQIPPYSLARVQMSVWTIVVVACYTLIWILVGDVNGLNAQAVTLTGASLAVALTGRSIDASRVATERATNERNAAQESRLLARTAELRAEISGERDETLRSRLSAELHESETRLARVQEPAISLSVQAASRGLLTDILHSDGGPSLHRIQLALWTLVIVVVFVTHVMRTLEMPEFDPAVFGLLGLSSATYLGFKLPEAAKK